MDPIVVTIVVLYLAGMLALGWWSSQRIQDKDDFLVAGRRLGPLMLAATLAATEVGGGSSLGVSEKAYGAWGLSAAWYVLAMAITFIVLAWIAPHLRQTGVRTVPEGLERRYGRGTSLLSAVILILPMIGLTAIQLMASATVLSVMTGLGYAPSVLVVTVVVTVYSIMGGLWSVTLTDAVQWVFIVVGSVLVIPYALDFGGGWAAISANVPAEKLSPTEGMGWKTILSLTVMYIASFSVGQESMQRFFGARDAQAARRGSMLAALFYGMYAFIPAIIGVLAFGLVQNGLIDATEITANGARYVLPTMATAVLPSAVVGLLFAGLISATMSSADSNLLAAGAIFSNDLYRTLLRPNATDAQILRVTRWTMGIVAFFSLGVALLDMGDMLSVLMFSFSLRAGGIFVPYIVGHFWRRATPSAAIAAIVVGSVVVVLAENGQVPMGGLGAAVPAVMASFVAFVVMTVITQQRSETI
jgi:SSS family solute:Na+ symporter